MAENGSTALGRVAVVGPFSGPRAAWGELLKEAVSGSPTARGSGLSWEFLDDRGDAETAVKLAEQIARDGGYLAVLGHFNGFGAAAAIPLYRGKVPLLLPLSTKPGLLRGEQWVLRWSPDDNAQMRALSQAILGRGVRNVMILREQSAYGEDLARCFAANFAGSHPASSAHVPGAPLRLAPEPGAILICGSHPVCAKIATDVRATGFAGLLAFTDDCGIGEFPRLIRPAPGEAVVARVSDGPAGLVRVSVEALTAGVLASPESEGLDLLRSIRTVATVSFTRDGDRETEGGWDVVELASL